MSRVFVVANTRFELSEEVIAKTSLLRDLAELTPDEIKLEGVELAGFQAFVDYVCEGKIPSEEHIQIFDYFHYPISESYDLSWQLESEMRNNFHSGKVYGSHHGLIELTEELWNNLSPPAHGENLLFASEERPEKAKWSVIQERLSTVREFLKGYPALFLAGGSLISILFGKGSAGVVDQESLLHIVKDLDFFVCGVSENEANAILSSLLFRMRKVTVKRTKNALTFFEENEPPKQVILRLFASPGAVLGGFDVDCCSIGYDGRNIWLTNRALYALRVGYNTVNLRLLSPSYERRLAKYGTRGFAVRVPGLDYSTINYGLLNYDLFRKLQESEDFDYNYPFLETGLDSLLFLDAHFRNLGSNVKTSEFFAGLCNSVCDYGIEDRYVSIERMITNSAAKEDFLACGVNYMDNTIYVRDPLGRYEPYKGQSEYSFLEMEIGTYYLKSKKGHQFLLNFPRPLAKVMDVLLPIELWKKDNPGEQMTSCFHSLVLEDESTWYEGRYSNLTEKAPIKCTYPPDADLVEGPEIQFIVRYNGLPYTNVYLIKDYEVYRIDKITGCSSVWALGLELFRVLFPTNKIRIEKKEIKSITITGETAIIETFFLSIQVYIPRYFNTADEYMLDWDPKSKMYRVIESTRVYTESPQKI